MRYRRIIGLALLGLIALASVFVRHYFFTSNVAGTSTMSPQVLGWIPYWDQEAAIAQFKKNVDVFDYVGVFWFALRKDGSISQYPYANIDESLITFAHEHKVNVLGLIANLPTEDEGGDWDADRVDKVIATVEARQRHIADLVALAKKYQFDGINIDYEALRKEQRRNFTQFIKELSEALHKEGKILGMSLHPKVGENNPRYSNGSQAQDWAKLARYADQLHVMTYEQHWSTSGPGAAAELPWIKSIMTYARKKIPVNKLYAGLPLYGYDWVEDQETNGLTYADVEKLIETYHPTIVWDSVAGSQHFTYEDDDGNTHVVWFEDARGVGVKLALFRQIGVPHFVIWRLGHEDPRVWDIIRAAKKK